MKTTRFGMIAVLAVTALLTVAHAQSMPAAPQTPNLNTAHVGNGSGLSTNDGIRPAFPVGWNYVHASYCNVSTWAGYTYLYVYPKEGGYFWTTNTGFETGLDPACQSGNWIGFYVYDSGGDWYQFNTYPYK